MSSWYGLAVDMLITRSLDAEGGFVGAVYTSLYSCILEGHFVWRRESFIVDANDNKRFAGNFRGSEEESGLAITYAADRRR